MDIILIAGLWLRQSAWDAVVDELDGSGHNAIALSLPGVDDESTEATLEDQVAAAVAAVDIADQPLVVGHSAACTIAWMVADQRPTNVRGVALIGGFPSSDGDTYADFFEPVDGLMPFPGWEPFEGPDSDDLDEQTRKRVVADMVAVPESVSRSIVRLTDERRFDVPVNLVCPEFSPDQAKAWISSGDVPELAPVKELRFTDIDSGHWPMVTKPAELARILAAGG
jgi:pimeloyl-ACP methyl ester carboxylesterase